ncbi:MAG: L,D-transpeptidase family protein [Acidobacteriota bacterium]|nr:L,D-transpeptidase family protein [Acidobacteriota bacterium]
MQFQLNVQADDLVISETLFFQTYASAESEREDKFTGGQIERAKLERGKGDIRITVDVPAFLLTLWQGDKEIAVYNIGVGQKDYPIAIGPRATDKIILNPDWIPPDSDWVHASKIKPGRIITASNPLNPLGKIKIPLGDGYLLHQAKGIGDLGSLVSHGCVRVMLADLFDLSKKIAAAYDLPFTNIEKSRSDKKQRFVNLPETIPVEIYYDTIVVEAGVLHIYPDVYGYNKNTVDKLRAQLEGYGIGKEEISDSELNKMLGQAKGKRQFVVSLEDIRSGLALTKGKVLHVVSRKK